MNSSLSTIAKALGGEVSGNSVLCPGPRHSAEDRSLSVTPKADAPDGFLVHSFAGDDDIACKDYVRAKLGLNGTGSYNKGNGKDHANASKSKRSPAIVATYNYNDENGDLLFQVLRKEPKTFLQRQPDGKGGWVWSTKGVRQVPYRLPELLAAEHDTVIIVEGEKDADNVAKLGFTATTNAGGAGKWSPDLTPYFKGRDVFFIPDNDRPGEAHAQKVCAALTPVAKSVRIVRLSVKYKDVSDWISAGGTADELARLLNEAPPIAPDVSPEETSKAMPRFPLTAFGEIKWTTRGEYIVKDVLPLVGLVLIYGPPKCGKSFWAFDLAMHVARGVLVAQARDAGVDEVLASEITLKAVSFDRETLLEARHVLTRLGYAGVAEMLKRVARTAPRRITWHERMAAKAAGVRRAPCDNALTG
ncbi:AAA family ATPase [Bradyrhizobium sp. AZCC 2289]|uniref:AAA family ATPase n=1 Tax=Bradyrhizobium sp. AZCC 2289 TaxID=3117026 RepID=UPI002FF3D22D